MPIFSFCKKRNKRRFVAVLYDTLVKEAFFISTAQHMSPRTVQNAQLSNTEFSTKTALFFEFCVRLNEQKQSSCIACLRSPSVNPSCASASVPRSLKLPKFMRVQGTSLQREITNVQKQLRCGKGVSKNYAVSITSKRFSLGWSSEPQKG